MSCRNLEQFWQVHNIALGAQQSTIMNHLHPTRSHRTDGCHKGGLVGQADQEVHHGHQQLIGCTQGGQ